jgi:hypothetical protein
MNNLRSQVATQMNAEAFAFNLKLCQTVLGKEREKIAQLIHRKLLIGPPRLILLVATPAAAVTLAWRTCAFRRAG